MTPTEADPGADGIVLHATTVAWDRRAALILGPSGAGKSALALQLLAWGALLVADDRTRVTCRDGQLVATCPAAIRGRIEARGVGILGAGSLDEAPIVLAVDLSATETERLPPQRQMTLLGCVVPLVHRVESGHFPAAILQYLRGGRNG